MVPDDQAPETRAAMAFMEYKGYPGQPPLGVEREHEDHPWYFFFEVPEGLIELEVDYDQEWWCTVVGFLLYDDQPEGWSPSRFVQQRLVGADSARG